MIRRVRPEAWLITDDEGLRSVCADACSLFGLHVQVLAWDEAAARRAATGYPDGVAVVGWEAQHAASDSRPYCDAADRLLILDSRESRTRAGIHRHAGVEVLPMPFGLDELEQALRWLAPPEAAETLSDLLSTAC